MGKIVSLVFGVYVAAAVAVAATGLWGASRGHPPRDYECQFNALAITGGTAPKGTTGPPNTLVLLLVRAAIWPLSLGAATKDGVSVGDWLTVRYDFAPDACRWGEG